jgi:hypothetical protein
MKFPKNNILICGTEPEEFILRFLNSHEHSPGFIQLGYYEDVKYCLFELDNNTFLKYKLRKNYSRNKHYIFWKNEYRRALKEFNEVH